MKGGFFPSNLDIRRSCFPDYTYYIIQLHRNQKIDNFVAHPEHICRFFGSRAINPFVKVNELLLSNAFSPVCNIAWKLIKYLVKSSV